jgi:nucleoside-diphosphate-sugar epimerase
LKTIITGSDGYLGSKVITALRQYSTEIIKIDKNSPKNRIDLCDKNSLSSILLNNNEDFELIHLAGQLPGTGSASNILKNAEQAINNLIEVTNPRRILFISSTAVYPIENTLQILTPAPWEVYGNSKLRVEQTIIDNSQSYTILRSGTMYDETRTGGIQRIIRRGISGKRIFLPKFGEVFHPFISTKDVVKTICAWSQNESLMPNRIVDLVAPNSITMSNLILSNTNSDTNIGNLPRILKILGSDNLPIAGISKWHLKALFYNIKEFPNTAPELNLSPMPLLLK